MNTIITEIPDAQDELVSWLEPIIVSGDLRRLVSELSVVSTPGKAADLNALLGGKLDEALQNGLGEVPEADLKSLFRHPTSLMQLQKQILDQGGDYWLKLIDANNEFENESAVRQRLAEIIERQPKHERENAVVTKPAATSASTRPRFMAIAAGVLLALTAGFFAYTNWPGISQTPVAWGWVADDQAELADLSETEYLNKLARGAEAWFNQRPTKAAAVQQRLIEFKRGCQTMIAAKHSPLQKESSDWLVARLKTCLNEIERELGKLEPAGADPIKVRTVTDEIVRGVADDLRDRASQA